MSHIHKVLGIAISGFLSIDNDIERGGQAVKGRMGRAVRIISTEEDNCKRIYVDDGSYTCREIAENRLRVKG